MASGNIASPELDPTAPQQSHYLWRLLEVAQAFFRTKPVSQDLKDCDLKFAQRLEGLAQLSADEVAALAAKMAQAPPDFSNLLVSTVAYRQGLPPQQPIDTLSLLYETLNFFHDANKEKLQALRDCNLQLANEMNRLGEISTAEFACMVEDLQALPLFQERLAFAVNYPPSKWLLEWEQPYLRLRRVIHHLKVTDPSGTDPYDWARDQQLQGICLSGGGIRSATFNLGVLQGLAKLGLLQNFDYMSSVSGGGYIHQFLAAWIKREEKRARKNASSTQPYTAGDGFREVVQQLKPIPNEQAAAFHPEPIKYLRRYSNYLTPSKGVFSADMWVAVAIWLRNTFLNQIMLLSGIFGLVLLAKLVTVGLERDLGYRLPLTVALLMLVVLYMGVVLWFQYHRVRENDIHKDEVRIARAKATAEAAARAKLAALRGQTVVVKSTGQANLYSEAKPPEVITTPEPELPVSKAVPMSLRWIEGDLGAILLAVLPLLIAGCINLHYLTTQEFGIKVAPPMVITLFVFGYLVLVALVVAVCGGAWREYAVLHELNKPEDGELLLPMIFRRLRILIVGGLSLCGLSALLSAGFSTLAFIGVGWFIWSARSHPGILAVFGPPLLLAIPFLALVFGAGLIGHDFPDWMREWLARVRAWSLMIGIFWASAFAIAVFGPWLVNTLRHATGVWISTLKWTVVTGWLATTAGSLMAGKSGKTSGRTDETPKTSVLDMLALVGPYVYIVGLVVFLSWGAWLLEKEVGNDRATTLLAALAVAVILFVMFGLRVDINEFSLNSFYCNRLTRCYLGATNSRRQPSPMTGFDDRDTAGMQIARLLPKTPRAMREGDATEKKDFVPYTGPFPIICTTLNLTFGEDLAWQERKAASFAFTPLYSGYTVGWTSGKSGEKVSFNGFVPTYNYAFPDGGINISTAVAISGAAANPDSGFHTSPATAFLMTMFDVRLGWWIRNPRLLMGLAGRDPMVRGRKTDQASPRFAPFQLAKELIGMTGDSSKYVNLSDGGHFDNMGLYELVRRRCYNILICDGEEDEKYVFEGLGTSIRKCRIDFGVEITMSDLRELRLDAVTGSSRSHFASGTIRYPEAGGTGGSAREGKILYLKSSLTGGRSFKLDDGADRSLDAEPVDILNYKLQHAAFPHDATSNQWFTESQFESYRRLGTHVVEEIGSCEAWDDFRRPVEKPNPTSSQKPGTVG